MSAKTPATHRRSRIRRRTAALLAAGGSAAALAAVPLVISAQAATTASASGKTLTVAADGSGDYRTVQAAINAVPAGGATPYTVLIKKGTYHEVVDVPAGKTHLTLKGATGNAEDVVITYGNAAGTRKPDGSTYGTAGSATATFSAADLTVQDITITNSFERSQHPEVTSTQAVAVNAQGDRQVFRGDRLIGHQDTLLVWSPKATAQTRQYFRSCFVAGDVDFVFGNATAVLDHVSIQLRDRGQKAGGNNGYLTAPNTDSAKKYGILITDSTVSSPAAANSFFLGRPWHPTATAVGQLVIRNTVLPAAIKTAAPWSDMSGFSWKSARFAEYRNTGPGATVNSNRPQLTDSQAASYTAQKYLAGTDGWNPAG